MGATRLFQWEPEVAGATFLHSDSVPVSKFYKPV